MNDKKAGKISKALADPNRLLILKELKKQKECVYCSELNDIIDLAQPSIFHHLKLLIDADIISSEKEGRSVKYLLNNKVMDEYIRYIDDLRKP